MTDQATPARAPHRVLVFSCDDRPGIVHAIAGAIDEPGGDITESQQFSSADTGRFLHAPADPERGRRRPAGRRAGRGRRAVRRDVAPRRGGPAAAHARAGIHRRALRERPAVPAARGPAARRDPARAQQPREAGRPRGLLRRAVRARARQRRRVEAGVRGARDPRGRGARHRAGGARALHADPLPRALRAAQRPDHQHPPLLPARLQGREPLQAGARARCQAHRRDRPLRHERPRRGPDRGAERRAGRPLAQRPRAHGDRPGRGVAHPHAGRALVAEHRVLLDGARTIIFR